MDCEIQRLEERFRDSLVRNVPRSRFSQQQNQEDNLEASAPIHYGIRKALLFVITFGFAILKLVTSCVALFIVYQLHTDSEDSTPKKYVAGNIILWFHGDQIFSMAFLSIPLPMIVIALGFGMLKNYPHVTRSQLNTFTSIQVILLLVQTVIIAASWKIDETTIWDYAVVLTLWLSDLYSICLTRWFFKFETNMRSSDIGMIDTSTYRDDASEAAAYLINAF